jgi:ornithine cyclodeaminase/alanine dehydrogenase-like protein (mu-crystallin family)
MLVLSRADVEGLLDLDRLIDAVADAMVELSAGAVSMPPRVAATVAHQEAFLAAMPAYLPGGPALTTKLVSVFPHNHDRGMPSHQAVIAAFDPETGEPLAVMDGTYVTAMRTAAGSALSARLLARPDASVLTIIGTGVQARSHGRMLPRVRSFSEARVAGRDPERAAALASDLRAATGVPFAAAESFEAAVDGADVVCATTHASEPVVRREWLSPGAHVTSVGFHPDGGEVDEAVVSGALVVVESRESSLAPFPVGAQEFAGPLRDGLLDPSDVAEIGEIVAKVLPGRTSPEQVSFYKSVGVAVQDAAAAALVLEAARTSGAGTSVRL